MTFDQELHRLARILPGMEYPCSSLPPASRLWRFPPSHVTPYRYTYYLPDISTRPRTCHVLHYQKTPWLWPCVSDDAITHHRGAEDRVHEEPEDV